jgi:hypothetical protein
MISAIVFCALLGSPCDGGKCILPRHVVSVRVDAEVRKERTVTVTKEATKARKLVAAIQARPHRGVKIVKAICPPYRR